MAELRRTRYGGGNVTQKPGKNFEVEMEHRKTRQSDILPAVVVRNATKEYKKGVPVLDKLNLTVQRGAIYSLLGSSGCGKTTTLGCIVGVRSLNAGNVFVFGAKPGVKGKQVGFMPQETSLYGDFSIAETLNYFGTLCGMDRESARKGIAFLTQLLSLPDSSQRVCTLSGGQRRRVSFAVALIHDPDLLILDEPTVGVDPLLREQTVKLTPYSIWNHLVRLSRERGTTVLITTHYIDEAKDSTTVGIMRYGRLLVEQDPTKLLQHYNTSSLESVVLELCKHDKNDEPGKTKTAEISDESSERFAFSKDFLPDDSPFRPPIGDEDKNEQLLASGQRVKSLLHKNLVILFRNLLLFFFSVVMPAFIILVMCIAFKDDPKNLDFGVVNFEYPNLSECVQIPARPPDECDVENLSCQYLKNIPTGVVDLFQYDSEAEAVAAVHSGSIWGYLMFPQEFSQNFYERSSSGSNIDIDVFNKSEIIVKMDQTSKNIVNKIKKEFTDGFEEYAKGILRGCGFDERQAEFTLNFGEPVFGTDDTKFIEFVAPSITVAWLFFFPIIASSIRYINEKKQGTYERSLVAGTKTWEVLFAYGCSECIVLVAQSCLTFVVLNVVIGIEVLGSMTLVMVLFIMSGFGGVSMGFFIGSLCNEEIEAALLAMALFFPNCFVSGILWPVEGMPVALQYIAYGLPCTLTSESMRSLFSRGWPFSHPNVWPGYISLVGWIAFYVTLTVLIQKFKTK